MQLPDAGEQSPRFALTNHRRGQFHQLAFEVGIGQRQCHAFAACGQAVHALVHMAGLFETDRLGEDQDMWARIALAYSPELRPGGFATATITAGTIGGTLTCTWTSITAGSQQTATYRMRPLGNAAGSNVVNSIAATTTPRKPP